MLIQKIKLLFRYIIKEIIAFLLFIPGLIFLKIKFSNNKVLFILNYHNFSKCNNDKLEKGSILETGYGEQFEKQIWFLKKWFNFCYTEDFYNDKGKNGINILITFDDGYKDNYDIAAPILKKYKIPTIFFVSTNYIDSDKYIMHDMIKYLIQKELISEKYFDKSRNLYKGNNNYKTKDIQKLSMIFNRNPPDYRLMMNSNEIKYLHRSNFSIGNHTSNHDMLSFLSKEQQYESISAASKKLHDVIGVKPNHIAYPNGLFNNKTLEVLDELDMKYGYLVVGGYNKLNDPKKKLKRIGINASDSRRILLLKLLVYSTIKYGRI